MADAPATLAIAGLRKCFADHVALDAIDLHLAPGHVLALLGPSGCGKTTLLRCIAGLTEVDGGRIAIGGETVASVEHHRPPEARRLGMVFQDYALWPHMSVEENLAFPLEMQGLSRQERRERVAWALSLVGLTDFARRQPGSLSGGQQQRVALARAIVARPRLLLMDEPLSNLDKGLRESLALEIRALIQRLGLTAVFVTHDQHEAYALADRVAVLQQGRLQQLASPETLFHDPATPEVARFLDAGTLIETRLEAQGLSLGSHYLPVRAGHYRGPLTLLLPRRALALDSQGTLAARVSGRLFQGDQVALRLTLDGGPALKLLGTAQAPGLGDSCRLSVETTALRAWLPDGTPLPLEPHHLALASL
ncbi:ABC transporter ATP-binding protein [Halomonas sp. 328]|uniref:ABC transporter ATP-binding protein n=1 Tax=Halomonas sp. 328 TaxID=2776704 RepID=UPI0018A74FFE|nr:ABC transporter ATP-binding protein [Halomonas sp. 328]MBF8224160.1 ABC transporter ATP-binding protein [Halomonas sp. 328]